ncbi:hypothetical protein ACWDTI_21480 [Gordonia sp. NPDC003424]
MSRVVQILASLVLILFAAVWIWIGFKMLAFHPTSSEPKIQFADAQVMIAGFLSSAVGAGTASVLGIEIQKAPTTGATGQAETVAVRIGHAAQDSWMLFAGIAAYAVVGIFVLLVYFAKSSEANDMISAFALGVLGWLAGAFAAVFRAD